MALPRTTRIALVTALAAASALAHAAYEFRVPIQGLRAHVPAPVEPEPEGFSLAQLVAAPSPVVLPETEVGAPVSVLTTLENRNAESVHIQSISSGLPQVTTSGPCLGATLTEGALCSFSTELVAANALNTSGAVLTIVTDRGNKTVPLGTLVVTAAQGPVASLEPATTLAFDTLELDASQDKTATLNNTGAQTLTFSTAPALFPAHAAFSLVETTCGESLAPNESCTATVRFTAQQSGTVGTALRFQGNMPGGHPTLAVTGTGLAATAQFTANPSANFGNFEVGGSASRTFTLRNTGNKAATGVYLTMPANAGLTTTDNSCGSVDAPISLAANAACSVTLTWQPAENASLSGATIASNGSFGAQAQVVLSGIAGSFDASSAWSLEASKTTAPDTTALNFGTLTVGALNSKLLYLRNEGTDGAMRVSFVLSGDVSQFQLATVERAHVGGATASCGWGASSPCLAQDVKQSGGCPHIRLLLQYKPTQVGSHSLTITPVSDNGTTLPGAITVTGAGAFNAQGAWSSEATKTTAPDAMYLDFGTLSVNAANHKYLFLRNEGTYGAMRVSFVLSGDVSQFQLATVERAHVGGSATNSCGWGASSPCLAQDVKGGGYPHIRLLLQYKPTQVGSHSLTVTPVSDNGTTLPGAITLTGAAN